MLRLAAALALDDLGWGAYSGSVPWRTTDQSEQAMPGGQRRDATDFHFALPAMDRYLCAV